MNGVDIENSDLATCCVGTFYDVEGINWVFTRVVLLSWTTVTGWFNCCNNWFRSGPCFRINSFPVLILFDFAVLIFSSSLL